MKVTGRRHFYISLLPFLLLPYPFQNTREFFYAADREAVCLFECHISQRNIPKHRDFFYLIGPAVLCKAMTKEFLRVYNFRFPGIYFINRFFRFPGCPGYCITARRFNLCRSVCQRVSTQLFILPHTLLHFLHISKTLCFETFLIFLKFFLGKKIIPFHQQMNSLGCLVPTQRYRSIRLRQVSFRYHDPFCVMVLKRILTPGNSVTLSTDSVFSLKKLCLFLPFVMAAKKLIDSLLSAACQTASLKNAVNLILRNKGRN